MDRNVARARTRRAFIGLGSFGAASIAGWGWMWSRPLEEGIPGPFRRVLDFNGQAASNLIFRDGHLAPEFRAQDVGTLRANGDIGLNDDQDNDNWQVTVAASGQPAREISLAQIRALPKSEHTTEFKCIEGWSTVVRWGGTRFRDFGAKYCKGSDQANFVGLTTPDGEYFVGVDMASMMHPQTLLCYEMNGEPLTEEHGAPLRLVIPVKYGIKNIKRIATISFADNRPADYWAKEGYDYYAGL